MIGLAFMATWLPAAASRQAEGVDGPFQGLYVAAAFAVAFAAGLALAYVMLFRRRDESARGAPAGRPHPLYLGLWTLLAAGLAVYALVAGFPGFLDQTVPPYGAYPVGVTARNDGFDFTYPGGHVADTLHVAVGKPVQLTMTSEDVIHGLSVPAMRVHQAILPGRQATAWFEATLADTFDLRSNIHGGEGAALRTALVSHQPADFDEWLRRVSDIFTGRTLAEAGELLYNREGCKACHTTDGTRLVGPSFKDVYGFEFPTRDGKTVLVDDAYIKESILTPNVSVVAGYEPVMTPYEGKLGDKEIEAITAWLKTLSSKGGAAEEAEPEAEGDPAAGDGQEDK
ncbi:c-type cytochrome [bacterium]|nr:c-type cytochrome [bacterium]